MNMGIMDTIASLDELLYNGETQRYINRLKRVVEKLKYALKEDPRDEEPGIRPPVIGPDPSPEGLRYSALIEEVVIHHYLQNSPKSEVAAAIQVFKEDMIDLHKAEIERLQR